jgi:hypothetical protein
VDKDVHVPVYQPYEPTKYQPVFCAYFPVEKIAGSIIEQNRTYAYVSRFQLQGDRYATVEASYSAVAHRSGETRAPSSPAAIALLARVIAGRQRGVSGGGPPQIAMAATWRPRRVSHVAECLCWQHRRSLRFCFDCAARTHPRNPDVKWYQKKVKWKYLTARFIFLSVLTVCFIQIIYIY